MGGNALALFLGRISDAQSFFSGKLRACISPNYVYISRETTKRKILAGAIAAAKAREKKQIFDILRNKSYGILRYADLKEKRPPLRKEIIFSRRYIHEVTFLREERRDEMIFVHGMNLQSGILKK